MRRLLGEWSSECPFSVEEHLARAFDDLLGDVSVPLEPETLQHLLPSEVPLVPLAFAVIRTVVLSEAVCAANPEITSRDHRPAGLRILYCGATGMPQITCRTRRTLPR